MKKTIVLLCAFGFTSAFAQNYEPGKLDFSVGFGARSSSSTSLTLEDCRALFPDSGLLKGDYSSYAYPTYYFNASSMVNLLWGIRLKQNDGYEQRLRVGVTFSGLTPTYASFYNENSFAYDTLTSARTGDVTYVDSVYSENLFLNISQKQVGLDVAYLIKSNQNGRWSFYGGAGLEVGAIINVEANISQSSYSYYSNDLGNYYQNDLLYGNNTNNTSEVERLDGGFYAMLYLPVGLDLRLSMKNAFWKKMHLYTEFRPSIQYSNTSLTNQDINLGMGFAVFGIRTDF